VVVAGFSKRPPNWFKQRNALELATVYEKKKRSKWLELFLIE
jgi:hypothetical protein